MKKAKIAQLAAYDSSSNELTSFQSFLGSNVREGIHVDNIYHRADNSCSVLRTKTAVSDNISEGQVTMLCIIHHLWALQLITFSK
jgi:hypothetical protein